MSVREQDDLPYRSPVTQGTAQSPSTTANETNYDTLKIVRELLADSLEDLYKNFNAFDVLKSETKDKAVDNLLRQIEGKQIAYDILSPVLEGVDNAIKVVDDKYKAR